MLSSGQEYECLCVMMMMMIMRMIMRMMMILGWSELDACLSSPLHTP